MLQEWASYRGQVLMRTVYGIMYYEQAVRMQAGRLIFYGGDRPLPRLGTHICKILAITLISVTHACKVHFTLIIWVSCTGIYRGNTSRGVAPMQRLKQA